MAAIAASVLDLSNTGPRRQGMTKQNNLTSLHGPRLEGQRGGRQGNKETAWDRQGGTNGDTTRAQRGASEDDIFAPPKGSSDESDAGAIEEGDDYAWSSLDELKPGSRKSKMPIVTSSAPARTFPSGSMRPNSPNADGRSGVTAGTLSQDAVGRNGKRKSDQISKNDKQDDDVTSVFAMNQPKTKYKKVYGTVKNHHISESKAKKMKKPKTETSPKPGSQNEFRTTEISALSSVEKRTFRKPATPVIPKSQNASSKSNGDTKDRDHKSEPGGNRRALRTAPSSSPKKRAAFRTGPIDTVKNGEDTGAETTTQPRRELRKREPLSSDVDKLNIRAGADLVLDASRRLGVPDLTIKLPPSSAVTGSPTARSSATSPLSSPTTSILDDSELIAALSPHEQKAPSSSSSSSFPASLCPLCRMPVDRLFLEGFAGTKRLTVAEQADFCKRHRLRSAREDWTARGLPEIDWSRLGERVTAHHDVLAEIIEGTRPSFYRNAYDELLKTTDTRGGRRPLYRTPQQSLAQVDDVEEMAAPGYYGSRGARIMIENIMTRFASHLRRRAPHDPLISGKGFFIPLNSSKNRNDKNNGGFPITTASSSVGNSGTGIDGYVQAVLVPETATLLVREDLERSPSFTPPCTTETARQVLRDTVELGRLLCEELEDDDIQDDEADADIDVDVD